MDNPAVEEQKAVSPVNGDKADEKSPAMGFRAIPNIPKMDEDTTNGHELSPPDSSSVSSVNPDMLGDEIIVGTHGNGDKPSPLRVVSDAEDGDTTNSVDDEPVSHYPKRKRASLYNDLGEDKMETSLVEVSNDVSTPRGNQAKATIAAPARPRASLSAIGAILLYLHEASTTEPPETREEALRSAVREARRRLQANPVAETAQPPSIAYGLEIPDHAQVNRHEAKRRRLASGNGLTSERLHNPVPSQVQSPNTNPAPAPVPATPVQPPYPGMLDSLPGTRPTRILVGCWSKSAVTDDRERHAVYGILGANDMFRVKLVRETLDGRYVDGNFPAGAGALWIPYEEVIFLPHIAHLSRPEMKEYVRVRQSQIDLGEKEDEKVSNETKAVYDAQTRVAHFSRGQGSGNVMPRQPIIDRDGGQDHVNGPQSSGGHELRHQRRDMMPRNEPPIPRHPLPEPDMRHPTRPSSIDPVERVQGLASREVARMEAVQMRHDRQHQNRFPIGNAVEPVDHHRHHFQENRDRMQKIWASQEQNRIRAGIEDAKMHMGIKYERKQNGPFSGKLVSQGAILTIDGEDYVEYRVLTKPSFF
ncbi:hypothetical protein CIB48_g9246 [Xylaria polymorpha]|nr:hypothetical protein CIB48_g9246 [Xylaria polymorpha]